MTLLLEQVLEVALLLLGLSLPLVSPPLGLLVLVAGQGATRFLHSALCPIHCPFVLVVPAALARHSVRSFPRSTSLIICFDEGRERRRIHSASFFSSWTRR